MADYQWALVIGFGVFLLITLYLSFFTVEHQTTAIVQRFGRFVRVARPGLNFKIPWLEWIPGIQDMRVQQLNVVVETKTMDDVFAKTTVSVQLFVLPDKVYEAFYKLDNATGQIKSFVFDVVRARVPKIKLDDLFAKKDEIADAVKSELAEVMDNFGYGIIKALVTDIDPEEKVKAAMNEINAAQRLRIAANEKGEADRILKVKAAEAEAQSKALQGKGIADQRRAIVEGLRESVNQFKESVEGATSQDVMNLVMLTQYLDTLKEIGASSRTNVLLIPHGPAALTDLSSQMREAMITADLNRT